MRKFLAIAFILAFLGGCTRAEKPVREGDAAPDFVLKDMAGRDTRLSDFKGKVVLVNFWATWCPPCRSEIPSMGRMNAAMSGSPFQLLAISIDEGGREPVEALFKTMKVTLPTLLDPASSIGKRYGITGVPETFIIDRKGIVVKKVIGPVEWDDPGILNTLRSMAR